MQNNIRSAVRRKRHIRVRKKIKGTAARPRLCVFRSLKHIQAQIIDDEKGISRLTLSTGSPELKVKIQKGGNIAAAQAVGQLIAEKAISLGIENVVFDRGGYLYHGRVQALAEAARKSGLKF